MNQLERERERKKTQDCINLTRMDFKEARVTFFYFTNNLHLSLNLKNLNFAVRKTLPLKRM